MSDLLRMSGIGSPRKNLEHQHLLRCNFSDRKKLVWFFTPSFSLVGDREETRASIHATATRERSTCLEKQRKL